MRKTLNEQLQAVRERVEKRKNSEAQNEEKCNSYCVFMSYTRHELYHKINEETRKNRVNLKK